MPTVPPDAPLSDPPEASATPVPAAPPAPPPFTAVVPPSTTIAGAATRPQLPPEVLAARTLAPLGDADQGRIQAWRGAGWATDFHVAAVPLGEVRPGGVPRDAIAPIDAPLFVDGAAADARLDAREPVVVFAVGADARAYPLRVLVWHEVVNDVVGGRPVAVTYCPRTNAARVFERRVQGAALRLGVTGVLRHGGLLMWDTLTQSWWQQFTGEALVGGLTGLRLPARPSLLVSYAAFRRAHPAGLVLGAHREAPAPYGRTPYAGHDTRTGAPPFFDGLPDPRLPPTERVLALDLDGHAAAYAFSLLARRRVLNDQIGARPAAAFWVPGTLSALDAPRIPDARDVGAAAAYDRRVNDRALTFEFTAGAFRDRETGSSWTFHGRAHAGPLAGTHLLPLVHQTPLWFAWPAFHPGTRLVAHPS